MQFREMSPSDFAFALRVTEHEGWGVTEKDLQRMLTLEPHGTLIATEHETALGLASGFTFGELGWIGNVIVANRRRGLGVGKALVNEVISYLRAKGAAHIALYTYEENMRFYERLGFEKVAEFRRYYGLTTPTMSQTRSRILEKKDLKPIAALDREAFGGDRMRLLELVHNDNPTMCFLNEAADSIDGFVIAKDYSTSVEIGPLVSRGSNVAEDLLNSVLKGSGGRPVELGIFVMNGSSVRMIEATGLSVQRRGAMMTLGESWRPNLDLVFAFGFLDKG